MLRKSVLILAVVMLFTTLAAPAMAAEPRGISAVPGLTVNGTTATCTLSAVGNYSTDKLVASIKLYKGSVLIDSWTATGNGYIFFSDTATISRGPTYTLKVTLTVNGVNFPVPAVSKS